MWEGRQPTFRPAQDQDMNGWQATMRMATGFQDSGSLPAAAIGITAASGGTTDPGITTGGGNANGAGTGTASRVGAAMDIQIMSGDKRYRCSSLRRPFREGKAAAFAP